MSKRPSIFLWVRSRLHYECIPSCRSAQSRELNLECQPGFRISPFGDLARSKPLSHAPPNWILSPFFRALPQAESIVHIYSISSIGHPKRTVRAGQSRADVFPLLELGSTKLSSVFAYRHDGPCLHKLSTREEMREGHTFVSSMYLIRHLLMSDH